MEKVTDFIFLGSKITVDDNCSHKIKRHFLLRRKAMTNLESILKSRDVALPTNVCLVKAKFFPVVIYGEGNGNPLQYSCLENPVDRGAWWPAVRRVAQSRTQMKQLSMHWRRKWQLISLFLPGESQQQRSLVGCHPWSHTESNMTEAT